MDVVSSMYRLRVWALITGLMLMTAALAVAAEKPEARVSIDVKNADVRDIVGALIEVAGFQAVYDPGLSCRLTLSVRELQWIQALQSSLDACGLGYEEHGSVVRIAKRDQLTSEAANRRRLAEQKAAARSRHVELFRLSYSRARDMAPVIKGFLSDRGEVVFDERTNTLIIID
jgi:type IV pilus assembly protein PilQ